MKKREYTLNDYRSEIYGFCYPSLSRRMVSFLEWVLSFLPGLSELREVALIRPPVKEFRRIWGIIDSMTPAERLAPTLVDKSRRTRIARGAGVTTGEVRMVIGQFQTSARMKHLLRHQREQSWRNGQRSGLHESGEG